MKVNVLKLRTGDVMGVTAPLHPWGIFVRALTHGKSSHVAQVFLQPSVGLTLAEMSSTERERRYFDPETNRLMTPNAWHLLPTTEAMERCTELDIRTGLRLAGISKYQPTRNPFRSRTVWVRRHRLYDDPAKQASLCTRMMRMFVSSIKYDYGELFTFLGMGAGDSNEDICSELPLRNMIADGGHPPASLLDKCSPASYEKWADWVDVSNEVKG